jgi:hypothetical protein
LIVSPVSDAPILIAPSSVAGTITAPGSPEVKISVPIQIAATDIGETLSVRVGVSGVTSPTDASFYLGNSALTPLVISQDASGFYFTVSGADVAKLPELLVTSEIDYRLTEQIKLNIVASSQDGSASKKETTLLSNLSIYQRIGKPDLDLAPLVDGTGCVVVSTEALIPFALSMPSALPADIGFSDVSILVTAAPLLGYFAVMVTSRREFGGGGCLAF